MSKRYSVLYFIDGTVTESKHKSLELAAAKFERFYQDNGLRCASTFNMWNRSTNRKQHHGEARAWTVEVAGGPAPKGYIAAKLVEYDAADGNSAIVSA